MRRQGGAPPIAGTRAGRPHGRHRTGGAPCRAIAVADCRPSAAVDLRVAGAGQPAARSRLGGASGARARRRRRTLRAQSRGVRDPGKAVHDVFEHREGAGGCGRPSHVTRSRDEAHFRLRGVGSPRDAAACPGGRAAGRAGLLRTAFLAGRKAARDAVTNARAEAATAAEHAFKRLARIARDATQRDKRQEPEPIRRSSRRRFSCR